MKENGKNIFKKICAVTLTAAMLMGGGLTEVGTYIGTAVQVSAVTSSSEETPESSFGYKENEDGGITITGYYGSKTKVTVPSLIEGKAVTKIDGKAFYKNTKIVNVILPNTLKSIGCIDNTGAFEYCTNLQTINIPDSIESIEEYAFMECSSLYAVHIGSGVKTIGAHAFEYCTALESITIPNNVKSVKEGAFGDCTSLESVTIENGVKYLGDYIFGGCTSLINISIPDSIKSICRNSFDECVSLETVYIGSGVDDISSPFYANQSLKQIIVSNENNSYTSIDGVLFNKDKTMLIQYPIGNDRTEYSVPNGVKSIYDGSFDCSYYESSVYSKLSSIIIPKSVKSIGRGSFSEMTSLKDVYYEGCESDWEKIKIDNYNNCLTDATIHYNYDNNGKYVEGKVDLSFRSEENKNKKLTYKFEYSDSLFSDKSTIFNQKLAILTLGMVMSGFSSGDSDEYWNIGIDTTNDSEIIKVAEKSRIENISASYSALGFNTIDAEYYNYDVSLNDTSDKVAFSIAHKQINVNGEEKTLVAVILRGGGYGGEWASNFNLGNNGSYHKAFNDAADKVVNEVIEYLVKRNLSGNVKIWMGGFSRSAATANLAAAKMDKMAQNGKFCSIKRDDIYTYTFATPQGIINNINNDIHNELYDNIFNIINPNDAVPTVPLSKWGFDRYGKSLTLPYVYITNKAFNLTDSVFNNINYNVKSIMSYSTAKKVTSTYNNITGKDIKILDAFKVSRATINDTDKLLYKIANNTDIFVKNKYQTAFIKAFEFINTNNLLVNMAYQTDAEKEKTIQCALKNMYGNEYDNVMEHIYYVMSDYSLSEKLLMPFIDDNNKLVCYALFGIIDYELSGLDRFISSTVNADLILNIIKLVLIENICEIGNNHYPELYLSWLESYDAEKLFGSKTYKKITTSCPVNVDVYSSDSTLVASIVNNEVVESIIPVSLTNDSKEIWLIGDDNYKLDITAYNEGKMTYSVEEYNENFELRNKSNFYDIKLKANQKFEANVSLKLSESVTLNDKLNNIKIQPDEIMNDNSNIDNVTIQISDDGNGYVFGNQTVIKGEYVSVEASPKKGYIFKGWYINDKLVSTESILYFSANEDVTLIAKFINNDIKLGDTNGDGKVNIADALMIARYDAKLTTLNDTQLSVSDVNGDSKVNIADALKIARYDAKLIDSLK